MRIIKRYSALILPFIFSTTVLATEPKEDRLIVGSFSSGVMENWEVKDFKGKTTYELVDIDGVKVLKAHSMNGASGLFKLSATKDFVTVFTG